MSIPRGGVIGRELSLGVNWEAMGGIGGELPVACDARTQLRTKLMC
jgi:hypothetical protein